MPAASFRHRVEATAGAEAAWKALQAPETWRSIGGADRIFDVRFSPDGMLAGYRFSATAGGRAYEGKATLKKADPGRRMEVAVDTFELDGIIAVTLDQPPGDGVGVTVELTVRSKGMLSSLFFPLIAASLKEELPARVERLAATL